MVGSKKNHWTIILIIMLVLTMFLYLVAIRQVWQPYEESFDDVGGGKSFGTVYLLIELIIVIVEQIAVFVYACYWLRPRTERTFPNHLLRIIFIFAATTLLFLWLNTTQWNLLLLSEISS